MFLHKLVEMGGFELIHHWHGIDVLIVLECALIATLCCLMLAAISSFKRRKRIAILSLVGAVSFATAAYAANTALSGLSASGAIAGANLFYVVQTVGVGGVKATATQVATYINSLFSGDATVSSGGTITFATVNGNVGTFGTATRCTTSTLNAKGLTTAISDQTCTPAIASLTGAGTGVLTALGVNVGTAGSFVVNGGAGGTPSSITLTNGTGLPTTGLTGRATLAQLPQGIANSIWINPTGSTADMQNVAVPACANDGVHALIYINGTGLQCAALTTGGAGTVTSVTPGSGNVSSVTGNCVVTAITVTGTISSSMCVNAQTGTTYAIVDGDRSKLVSFSNAASVAVSIAQAGAASAFQNGWFVDVINKGVGTVTITPATSTINGTTTLVLTTGQGARIYSDGTNYQVNAGSGSGGSGISSLTPGGGLVSGVTASCTQTAITASGTLSAARCINAQTGTTYAILDSDRGKFITGSNAAAQAYSIAQAGAASAFVNGWSTTILNKGVGTLTITPTTSTINGAATYLLFAGQSVTISSDGSNYQVDPGTTGGVTVSLQTGANYAFVASDFAKLVNLSNASNQIPTMPTAASLGANWFVQVCNQGAGTQTITPTTSTIGGASTFVLPAGSAAAPKCVGIVSDGTNYQVAPEFTTGGSSTITAGTTPTSGITSGDIISSTSNLAADSGLAVANVATLSGAQTFTGAKTFGEVIGGGRTVAGTTDTLAATDCGTTVVYSSASAVTVTVPQGLPSICTIALMQTGAGKVSTNGSAVTPATQHASGSFTGTRAQYSVINITNYTTNTVALSGDAS